jgi:hypothetical protein
MDLSSPKICRNACAHKGSFIGDSNLFTFSLPNTTRNFVEDQNYTKEFFVERSRGQKQMGVSGMGQSMLSEKQRRSRVARSKNNK